MKSQGVGLLCIGVAACFGLGLTGPVQAMQINQLAVVAANDIQPAAGPSADVPMGQSAQGQVSLLPEDAGTDKGDNLFGLQGGYFHPYLTLQEAYTDNVYDVRARTSSSVTTISPGMWFALPRQKDIPVSITPHNTSPGGLQYQFKDHEGKDRIQAYALGGLDFKYYSADSNLNTTDGVLEGLFRYNMRGGLSLQLVDRYTHAQEGFYDVTPGTTQAPEYNSNFVLATADWRISEKLRTKLEYSNFVLDYDSLYAFRSRVDNGIDLYGYYVYSGKTSFFLEDKIVDVHYNETSGSMNDNTQNFVYAGIKWDTTEKLSILAKTGLQTRNFDNNDEGRKDYRGLAADLQTVYRATIKTKFTFDLYRTDEETDFTNASGKEVTGVTFGYRQKYTDKINGSLDVTYENADYAPLTGQSSRDDDRIFIRPAVQYLFRDWLIGEIAYEFDNRDSSDSLYNYQSNTILLNLKFAL